MLLLPPWRRNKMGLRVSTISHVRMFPFSSFHLWRILTSNEDTDRSLPGSSYLLFICFITGRSRYANIISRLVPKLITSQGSWIRLCKRQMESLISRTALPRKPDQWRRHFNRVNSPFRKHLWTFTTASRAGMGYGQCSRAMTIFQKSSRCCKIW